LQNNRYSMEELYPILLEVIESGGEFRLWPRGTSMLPLLREGRDSVALVKPGVCRKHDICLYRRENGAFVLHRLMKFEKNGAPVFCGDNQTALEYGVPEGNIIARVLAIYRGEKRISVTALRYRLYVCLHTVLPLRRVLFFPRRLISKLKKRK